MTLGRDFFRRLTPARLALLIHVPLILSGLPFGSFDAYTHIFLADHYRRAWFDLVEPKWFGGFSVASYPPLVHQLIALLSRPVSALAGLGGGAPSEIRYTGESIAYCGLLLLVLAILPSATDRFARIFVPARAARTAGWLALGLPSVYLTAYSFGQLPTLAATTALLWAASEGWQFAQTGRARHWWLAVLGAGVTAALHHAVLLFALVLGGVLAARAAWRGPAAIRLAAWAFPAAGVGLLTVWPFVEWSRGYVPQVPIDHLSRHNVVTEWMAGYYFLWPMYGPILLALPIVLARLANRLRRRAPLRWRIVPLAGAATLLFVLGLGGTTPLPALLFGANWEWLTYDRFSLWAGLTLLPLAGVLWHFVRRSRWRGHVVAVMGAFCLYGALAAALAQAQPPAVDTVRIARWLNDNTRGGERYITLGFGDQLAKLSVLTDARTLDGTYFTARENPALRSGGLGTLDGVRWQPAGVWGVRPFLLVSYQWGVRWVLSRDPAFDPVLRSSGYQLWGTVAPGVQVWRNTAAWVRTEFAAPVENDPALALWWGIAPPAALLLAAGSAFVIHFFQHRSLFIVHPHTCQTPAPTAQQARVHPGAGYCASGRCCSVVSLFIVPLFIVLWPFWYYVPLWIKPYDGIYFTYTSGLLFAADAVAFVWAVAIVWQTVSALRRRSPVGATLQPVHGLLLALILFSALSIPSAVDPALAIGFTLHLLAVLAAGWAASRAGPQVGWRGLASALTAAVMIQSVIGLLQAAVQNTAWLDSLGLAWPGALTAHTRGASVVGLPDGARWLRAYGTLPHPNMLGAFLALSLAGPLLGYVQTRRVRWLLPLVVGMAALFLTFSRAAWLAGAVTLLGAIVLAPRAVRQRAFVAAISCALAIGALALAFAPLVRVRVSASAESEREVSSALERRELARIAIDFIRGRPLFGVGAGGFTVAMTAQGAPIAEPVHNVLLLAGAETGLGGAAAVFGLGGWILWRAGRRRGLSITDSVIAAGIVSLIVAAQFDHFMWSLSAGRLWAGVMIGLWVGAAAADKPDT